MNKTIKLLAAFCGLVCLIVLASFLYAWLAPSAPPGTPGADTSGSPSSTGAASAKTLAPDFQVSTGDGGAAKLSDFSGKPVVLNFWASWCPPCRSEMPHFDKLYAEYKDEVVFLMVNVTDGQRETIESGTNYVQAQGYRFPLYFDTTGEAWTSYGVSAIPMTIFIDREGYRVNSVSGSLDERALRENIAVILSAGPG